MLKTFYVVSTLLLIIFSNIISAQNSNSIEFNGGILFPNSSSNGLAASVQFNYAYKNNFLFYIYTGYLKWDKYNVNYTADWSPTQTQTNFQTYISDNHVLIPVYVGTRLDFITNRYLNAFSEFEIGYSRLSYNSYSVKKEVDPNNGTILSYNPDLSTRKKVNENLIGLGAGIGLSHKFFDKINLILLFKLNSPVNSERNNFLSGKGTYTSLGLGFSFDI